MKNNQTLITTPFKQTEICPLETLSMLQMIAQSELDIEQGDLLNVEDAFSIFHEQ